VCGALNGCAFDLGESATTCTAAGTKTIVGACAADPYACAPGYVCVGSGDCRKWCTGLTTCPAGTTCKFGPRVYGGINYGFCLP
jgi:hypothetical protein